MKPPKTQRNDIDERRNAERVNSLLAAIVDSSDDAIISKNLDGIITSWNRSAERLFGYAAAEAIGQHISLIIPEDRRSEEVDIIERLKRGERVDHFETLRMRKDGTLLDLSLTISPVKDSTGHVIGASKVARDIREAKLFQRLVRESEDRFRRLSENLESQIRSRTEELEQRNTEILKQAEQLQELSSRLLTIQDEERRHLARELHDSAGQIITVIGLNLAAIAQENPSLKKSLEMVQNMVQQLSNEIRTTSHLLHPPLLDEVGLFEAIKWYVNGLTERSGLTVECDIPEDFGRLPADLELVLFRIVQECLTNIHRHSGSKIARIKILRDPTDISVNIQDDGKGISDEKLTAIKAHKSGVGIMGIRERIRHLKGTMDIDSNSNGTTILVTLPIANAQSKPAVETERFSGMI